MDQQEPQVAFQKLLDQGSFTLRSMYEQCQKILNQGMLLGLISAEFMMPQQGHEKEEGHAKMKCYMTMMDSMMDQELDSENPKLMVNESRIREIARGYGRDIREVMEMFNEYERISKIWSKMKRLKIPKNGDMDKNNAENCMMSKVLPPQMMKQIGSMFGLQNLMKQIGSASKDKMV